MKHIMTSKTILTTFNIRIMKSECIYIKVFYKFPKCIYLITKYS